MDGVRFYWCALRRIGGLRIFSGVVRVPPRTADVGELVPQLEEVARAVRGSVAAVAEWLNANAGAVQGISTVVLVVATAAYVVLTWRMTAAAQMQSRIALAAEREALFAARKATLDEVATIDDRLAYLDLDGESALNRYGDVQYPPNADQLLRLAHRLNDDALISVVSKIQRELAALSRAILQKPYDVPGAAECRTRARDLLQETSRLALRLKT